MLPILGAALLVVFFSTPTLGSIFFNQIVYHNIS